DLDDLAPDALALGDLVLQVLLCLLDALDGARQALAVAWPAGHAGEGWRHAAGTAAQDLDLIGQHLFPFQADLITGEPGLFFAVCHLIPSIRYRNVDVGMPSRLAASAQLSSPLCKRRQTSARPSGSGRGGRPNRTPRALAAAMPSAWRWRMLARSFSATKDSTCNTMSAKN